MRNEFRKRCANLLKNCPILYGIFFTLVHNVIFFSGTEAWALIIKLIVCNICISFESVIKWRGPRKFSHLYIWSCSGSIRLSQKFPYLSLYRHVLVIESTGRQLIESSSESTTLSNQNYLCSPAVMTSSDLMTRTTDSRAEFLSYNWNSRTPSNVRNRYPCHGFGKLFPPLP